MKKFISSLILMFFILLNTFSQDKKHTIYINFSPAFNGIFSNGPGLGIGYDYAIGQQFSVGGYVDFYIYSDGRNTYDITITGKYYPLVTEIGNLSVDGRLGYRRSRDLNHCLVGFVHAGWKFIFTNGLVLEPGLGIRYNIFTFSGTERNNLWYSINAIAGWAF